MNKQPLKIITCSLTPKDKSLAFGNEKILTIRPGTPKDAEKYIEYVNAVAGESDNLTFGKGEYRSNIQQQERIIREFSHADNELFLIAEIDGEIVGNLTFRAGKRSRNSHVGEFGVSVQKQYWGMAIGKKMMEYLLSWARTTEEVRKINLKVREDNIPAIKLYEKLGFKKEGVVTREFLIEEKFYNASLMGICIDP
ncbi:N-acetyltransferase [Bacillus sp. M6-12]|uniref:GNAT family N-acetyltransferase n=1 Tax=Bacillus sp. M6-12 TaxID=2054166 RepID=UPI000C76ECB7|nr:GNAT family N-acetyltransferase [Bacillus sp. M6-12]PLS15423.1 N-acetyltransferase [Bacillus sp. M6-12]